MTFTRGDRILHIKHDIFSYWGSTMTDTRRCERVEHSRYDENMSSCINEYGKLVRSSERELVFVAIISAAIWFGVGWFAHHPEPPALVPGPAISVYDGNGWIRYDTCTTDPTQLKCVTVNSP